MKLLLIIMTVFEGLTGIALFIIPKYAVSEVLNTPLDTAGGVVAARIAGAALITLGICCWQARGPEHEGARLGIVRSMLFYNTAASVVLVYAGLRLGLESVFIWPMTVLHGVLALWCAFVLWAAMRKQLAASPAVSA